MEVGGEDPGEDKKGEEKREGDTSSGGSTRHASQC
jgi:hypothetical protein